MPARWWPQLLRARHRDRDVAYVVIDGAGWAPAVGERVHLEVREPDGLVIGRDRRRAPIALALGSLVAVDVEEDADTHHDAQGGLALLGAVAAISRADSLTREQARWAAVTIVAPGGWVRLLAPGPSVAAVQAALEPARAAVAARPGPTEEPGEPKDAPEHPRTEGGGEVLANLERLSALHAAGVLDDHELRRATARLLGSGEVE